MMFQRMRRHWDIVQDHDFRVKVISHPLINDQLGILRISLIGS